jgi:hypothetical protein
MKPNITPDKNLVSVCGLFCMGCGVYYSTRENNHENLQRLATRMGIPVEEMPCHGCRTEVRTAFCKNCTMLKCSKQKGVDFCVECNEYPCRDITDFQAKMPHRVELWKSLARIKEIGWEKWFAEMVDYYTCHECGTVNGWYDFKCRSCGASPGNQFVRNNLETLSAYFKK